MSDMQYGMGWLHDYPDLRDYTVDSDTVTPAKKELGAHSVKADLKKVGVGSDKPLSLPGNMDLRAWCSPIENQLNLGSCTANAAAGVVEYFERRAFGNYIDASRLFIYKVERDLLGWTGDTGAYLRTAMGALATFGAPPEKYWPYQVANYEIEPSAFCYAFAQDYKAISYYRLDPPGITPPAVLNTVKTWLAAGLPSMFGFTVYNSYSQAASNGGKFPFPMPGERVVGGHAIVAVGYDDGMHIKNATPGAPDMVGALLIRNSWGTSWGNAGYGWLPYQYVLCSQAVDWWSLVKSDWINTGNFGF